MKTTKWVPVAIAAALALSGTARADDLGAELLDDVELTAAQERRVRKHQAERRATEVKLQEATRAYDEALRVELARAAPDRALLRRQLDAEMDARTEQAFTELEDLLKVHRTLSPRQRQQLVRNLDDDDRGRQGLRRVSDEDDRGDDLRDDDVDDRRR